MSIWKQDKSVEQISSLFLDNKPNMFDHVGIEFVEKGDDFLSARIPVDHRTTQPFGILHGGASVVLAETVGSMASVLASEPSNARWFGLEVNANHLRGASEGYVTATAKPIHLGRTTHVWDIRLRDDAGRMTCIARLTMINMGSDAGGKEPNFGNHE